MPRVFAAEIEAGLEDLLSKSVAHVIAPLRLRDADRSGDLKALVDSLFTERPQASVKTPTELTEELAQPDLAYIQSILVSAGWNLNDDVFLPDEIWAARATPVHKPINVEHDETKIIGHMIQSQAVDKEGNAVEVAEGEQPPAEIDIEVAGVLYRWLPELAEQVEALVEAAKKGDLFVSMEAWFDEFAYALKHVETGATRIVARDQQTAFLTKHLRAYGGNGKFEQYRVGRVLRNIVFAGKGLVAHPANPESVIKDIASAIANHSEQGTKGGATSMADTDTNAVQEVQATLDETTKALETKAAEHQAVVAELEAIKAQKLDEKVQQLTATIAERDATIATVTEANTGLEKQVAELTERASKVEAELAAIRKAETARSRLAQLSQVKKIEDTEASLKELAEMSDETFAIVLKYAGEKAPASTTTEQPKTEQTTTEEAATAALETVQPVEEPNLQGGTQTEGQSLMTVAKATANLLLNRKTEETM